MLVSEMAASSEEMSAQARELLSMIRKFNVGKAADTIAAYKQSEAIPDTRKIITRNNKTGSRGSLQQKKNNAKDVFDDDSYEKF